MKLLEWKREHKYPKNTFKRWRKHLIMEDSDELSNARADIP